MILQENISHHSTISETTNISRRAYGKLSFSETLERDAIELHITIAHYIILE